MRLTLTHTPGGVVLLVGAPEGEHLICAPTELTAWSLLAVWLVERRERERQGTVPTPGTELSDGGARVRSG